LVTERPERLAKILDKKIKDALFSVTLSSEEFEARFPDSFDASLGAKQNEVDRHTTPREFY
jgi:hypothetical protein